MAGVGVVVDADDVEEPPVGLVVLGCRVTEVAVEHGAAGRGRLRGEAVEAALHPHRVEVAVQHVLYALQNRLPRHDPGHEEPELAAHAEVDARALPPQPLREAAALGQVFQDVPLRGVRQGRLEPYVQSTLGGLGGGGREAFDAVAGDVDGVGVQLAADGADVPAHPGGAPRGRRRLTLTDRVDDTAVPKAPAGGLGRLGRQHRRREPEGRRPCQELRPIDPLRLLHALIVAAGTGPRRPPMVYGSATKE